MEGRKQMGLRHGCRGTRGMHDAPACTRQPDMSCDSNSRWKRFWVDSWSTVQCELRLTPVARNCTFTYLKAVV